MCFSLLDSERIRSSSEQKNGSNECIPFHIVAKKRKNVCANESSILSFFWRIFWSRGGIGFSDLFLLEQKHFDRFLHWIPTQSILTDTYYTISQTVRLTKIEFLFGNNEQMDQADIYARNTCDGRCDGGYSQ